MFRAIADMIALLFTALSNVCVALNSLARAGAERTSIVEEKSVRAAALSSLRGETDFIGEYAQLQLKVSKVKVADRKDAESYLQKFRDTRKVYTI